MFHPESYTIIAVWFPRLLGMIYFFAFGALLFQIRGLIGSNGILPARSYLELLRYHYPKSWYYIAPSVFWINSSDKALMVVTAAGTILSVCLMFGFLPSLLLLLLYVLYLSIVSAGQDFLSFGWEGLLLETTAHAFFMSLTPIPNLMVWFSYNFLLWRFHFQAGAVKLQSRDPSWRNLTAIAFHYQTQPLPNTVAWYAYKLPMWFQKQTCIIMFVIEMVFPFGIFFGDEVRLATFVGLFGLQFMIWFTGNFSYLNHLTAVMCTILLSNSVFIYLFGMTPPEVVAGPLWFDLIITFFGAILFGLQFIRIYHQFFPTSIFARILHTASGFHLANLYGIFAVMTTKRYEIVVEGSEDGKTWKEYTFKYKPSEITRRPRRISPYQPRLDWQAWFLPFTNFQSSYWFQSFLCHVLKGTPEVLKLLRDNPFPNEPPKFVRAIVYDYEFSSFEEKKSKGWWWRRRNYVGFYSPILSLKT